MSGCLLGNLYVPSAHGAKSILRTNLCVAGATEHGLCLGQVLENLRHSRWLRG